jgi:long-chain acyl-CoA synthetase
MVETNSSANSSALPSTLPSLFFVQVRARGEAPALRQKRHGIWRRISWREYGESVRAVAAALIEFGLSTKECVAILGDNRPEWLYCHLGAMAAGGTSVGIYPSSSPEQIAYLLDHCEARLLFVENAEQLDKVLEVLPRTRLARTVVWDKKGLWGFSHERAVFFDAFLAQGAAARARADERLLDIEPEQTAMIIYTSGTTGPPKGAMISHRNIVWMSAALLQVNPLTPADETISCLPFAHVYENILSVFQAVRAGYTVSFVERPETLFDNLREVSPTYFGHVPRLWEKLMSGVELKMEDSTVLKRTLYRAGLRLSRAAARERLAGRRPSIPMIAAARLADWIVFGPLRRQLGLDRVKLAVCGAAPASPELFEYFRAIGVPLVEGYGQTEATGVISIDSVEAPRPGTVGSPIPGIEVRLAGDGEILTRGPHVFRGYLKDEELTARTIDAEGFLHTGDVGAWDGERLRIVDRKKDIIVTAGGKNITPALIENKLKLSPYIEDAVVIGDRRKYLIALLLIDEDNVTRYAQDHRIPFATFADLTREPGILSLLKAEVDRANRTLSQVEAVKRFALLPRRFYEEEGDVTPTRKVKRRNLEERYAELIGSLYGD